MGNKKKKIFKRKNITIYMMLSIDIHEIILYIIIIAVIIPFKESL